MPLLENLNLFVNIVGFGCVAFAVSNLGIKLGKLKSFRNTSGFKYVSASKNSDALYTEIAKVSEKDKNAPSWAKNKEQLKNWCSKNQQSARTWKDASQYCLIKNIVRYRLIDQGYTLNETNSDNENVKCSEIFDYYADENLDSLGYLYGKNKCATGPSSS